MALKPSFEEDKKNRRCNRVVRGSEEKERGEAGEEKRKGRRTTLDADIPLHLKCEHRGRASTARCLPNWAAHVLDPLFHARFDLAALDKSIHLGHDRERYVENVPECKIRALEGSKSNFSSYNISGTRKTWYCSTGLGRVKGKSGYHNYQLEAGHGAHQGMEITRGRLDESSGRDVERCLNGTARGM